MIELTRQEKQVIVFLLAAASLGAGIAVFKNLSQTPKIEVVSNPQADREAALNKIINLNTAQREDLMKLEGIGPALAEEIIAYRAQRGGFQYKEELKEVKGIGPAKFDRIKEHIVVE